MGKGKRLSSLYSTKYRDWRNKVLKTTGSRCAICGERASHVHHIKHWASHPRLRYNVKNGLPLCLNHHGTVHFTTYIRNDPKRTNPFETILAGIAYRVTRNKNTVEVLKHLPVYGDLWLYNEIINKNMSLPFANLCKR